ncbi:MAG TPA: hypothetical protein G4N92_08160 [Anaerolineae bacterium]|nr:hypothetical protein [Anaerolineae bacterium]
MKLRISNNLAEVLLTYSMLRDHTNALIRILCSMLRDDILCLFVHSQANAVQYLQRA